MTAERTTLTDGHTAVQETTGTSGDDNDREARTGGNNINRRDVNESMDVKNNRSVNSREANNGRDANNSTDP